MVPVLNHALLEHVFGYLRKHNVTDVILALGERSDQIQKHFGDGTGFDMKIVYSVEDFPMGTAGAVKNAEDFLDRPFIVFNGDVFTDIDLTAMMDLHREKKASVSIALTPVEDPTIYGVVETDEQGRVRRFVEKPSWDKVTTNMINAGIYILEPKILSYVAPGDFSMFERDVFPPLLEKGEVMFSYSSDAYWIDIGTPEKYLRLNHALLHRYIGDAGMRFEGESAVDPAAQIEGPVVIGEGCFMGKNSMVKGPAVVGAGCWVEEGALIEGAVLWQNCRIGKEARLRNCVVASNCHIEDETEVLDGCVLGDSVRIGKGNKLAKGTRIWSNKAIEPTAISF
jgi:mannose-1-phosphate guanylyltransferase